MPSTPARDEPIAAPTALARTLASLRYHRGTSILVFLLFTLATGSAIFAPTYATSVKQATIREVLGRAFPGLSGVRVETLPSVDFPASPPGTLADAVPAGLDGHLRPAITHQHVSVAGRGRGGMALTGALTARAHQCGHVRFGTGRCPATWGEIIVSSADAALHGWQIGSVVVVTEQLTYRPAAANGPRPLTVVGTYTDAAADSSWYWHGEPLIGRSGRVEDGVTLTDPILAAESTLADPEPRGHRTWQELVSGLDRAIDTSTIKPDDTIGMRHDAVQLSGTSSLRRRDGSVPVVVTTQLPALLDDAATGCAQVDQSIPVLFVGLALVITIAAAQALAASVDERRSTLALRRLHGTPTRRVTLTVVAELGVLLAAALPCGLAVGLVARELASSAWLDQNTDLVIDAPVLIVVGLAEATAIGLLLVTVHGQTHLDVLDLLRRTPQRSHARTLGTTVLAVVAFAGFAALATGSLTGPASTAGPLLLALGIGLLAAAATGPLWERWARVSLRQGRPVPALVALSLARRIGGRRLVTVLTVATALLVFATDVLVVVTRNIERRAFAEVGAPAVVTTVGARLGAVRAAVTQVDPSHTSAAITATVSSAGRGGLTMVGVDPDVYARVAYLPPEAHGALDRIRVQPRPPITWTGRRLTAQLSSTGQRRFSTDSSSAPVTLAPATLDVSLLDAAGTRSWARLTSVPAQAARGLPVTADLSCATGCAVVGLRVSQEPGQPPVRGQVSLGSLAIDGVPVHLGSAADWSRLETSQASAALTTTESIATMDYALTSDTTARLTRADDPAVLPAVLSGEPPAGSSAADFAAPGLDGIARPMTAVATWPYIPGTPRNAALVDLPTLERSGAPARGVEFAVLLADGTPADRITSALAEHGVAVGPVRRATDLASAYERQPAAWSARLGIVVGLVAASLALLIFGVLAGSTRSARVADSRALRSAGLPARAVHRAARFEQAVLISLGVGLGTLAGALGAIAGLPLVPIFLRPETTAPLDLSQPWPTLTAVAATTWGVALLGALTDVAAVARHDEPGRGGEDRHAAGRIA